jgi:hypothetical protein
MRLDTSTFNLLIGLVTGTPAAAACQLGPACGANDVAAKCTRVLWFNGCVSLIVRRPDRAVVKGRYRYEHPV